MGASGKPGGAAMCWPAPVSFLSQTLEIIDSLRQVVVSGEVTTSPDWVTRFH